MTTDPFSIPPDSGCRQLEPLTWDMFQSWMLLCSTSSPTSTSLLKLGIWVGE